ncbi:MAG: DUF58 domain-containing protein [Capsulimonas sp.]|uniref:DUF58 domain-containing protein n=1 Tax=Capsulimonas sp. TaxID=2494211 RepID=UPI003263213D
MMSSVIGEYTSDTQQRKYLQTSDLRRLRNFQFAAKLIVEGSFQGKHRSPYYDYSAEFADYRPYTPGDEIRAIDWRAYARTDRFYIKLSRKETDMNCYLLVDKSNSMAYKDSGGVSKLEYASYMAAGLAYLIIRQGDKASLSLGDDALRAYIPAGGSQRHLQRILIALEQNTPGGETGLPATLATLFGVLKRKGLLIVISDFLDEPERVFSTLNMFAHKGFSVLLFQVLTDGEMFLPDADNALFQDMESPAFAVADPNAIRVAYQAELQAFLNEISTSAKARRMQYQLALTSAPYYEALEAFLTARGRM